MGRGKQKRKKKLEIRRASRKRMGKIVRFNLANAPTKFKGLVNSYAYQSNMHNLIFKGAYIENVNYRASIITDCNFKNAKLIGVDFICVNLKKTNFQNATFENVIFFGTNLKNADFKNVVFKNVTFINTNIKNAKNLCIDENVTILNSYPNFTLNEKLTEVLLQLSNDSKIFKYHTLHVNKNKINKWFLYILLKEFSQENLIRGFQALARRKDKRHFYTIYSLQRFLNIYLKVKV
ncbi:pentapeptide repeat-containing protein [Proteinivorax tanatarense]|uniref:Pentapeptide repeat-containing protein n=1 Tax=Proteinivorax tanatarense TaxID=1260629 RepID=A0AAU7VLR6_9FIRM